MLARPVLVNLGQEPLSDESHCVSDGAEGGGDLPRVRENLWCPYGRGIIASVTLPA